MPEEMEFGRRSDGVSATPGGSTAALLRDLLTRRLARLPPIEQFIVPVKVALSLHHRLYRFTAAAAPAAIPARTHGICSFTALCSWVLWA